MPVNVKTCLINGWINDFVARSSNASLSFKIVQTLL